MLGGEAFQPAVSKTCNFITVCGAGYAVVKIVALT
jgi:hypothetical protein